MYSLTCLFEKTNQEPNTQVYQPIQIKSLPKKVHLLHQKTESRRWLGQDYKSMSQNRHTTLDHKSQSLTLSVFETE